MKKYTGVKEILATPMNRKEYNDYRGWELPVDENGDFSNETIEVYRKKWDYELTKIKNGFLAAKEIEDKWILETLESPEWIAFNEGFDSLKKCYFGLWN